MSKPKSAKADVAEGTYDFIVKTIADIGTQTVSVYGKPDEEEEKKQIIIVVELPELSAKGKIVSLAKWATNSSSAKAFGGELMKACGLNPKTADWDDLLGKAFEADVEHSDSGNAKIVKPRKHKNGYKGPKGFMSVNSCYLDESFDKEKFEAMPEYIQNAMIKAPEFEEFGGDKKSKAKKSAAKTVTKKGKGK